MTNLVDGFNRRFGKLRVSLTHACNFRCTYCRPAEGVAVPPESKLLSIDEIVRVCRVAATLGMTRIRLTGGEPLLRSGVVGLVAKLRGDAHISDVAMTTNASLLRHHATPLRDAGLEGVNISLDTLCPRTAAKLARGDVLAAVLDGIAAACDVGLAVKLNCVVVPNVNDSPADLASLVRYATDVNVPIRFIEYMPMGVSGDINGSAIVTAATMRQRLAEAGIELASVERPDPADPASPWRTGDGGSVGFIHSVSQHFCDACDRMRLTAEGTLRPCLHQDVEHDLRPLLQGGCSDGDIADAFVAAAGLKWAGHQMNGLVPLTVRREMVTIGG